MYPDHEGTKSDYKLKVWQHLQSHPTGSDLSIPLLDGEGVLYLRLDFSSSASPLPKLLSVRGRTASTGSKGPDSPSRFSMIKRKEKVVDARGL